VDSRQNRVARNEGLYREVNERIRAIHSQIGDEEMTDFLCECGREDCTQPIRLSLSEYEEIRSDPTHFAVVRGHEVVGDRSLLGDREIPRRAGAGRPRPGPARIGRTS
jgi:hypothetical protein